MVTISLIQALSLSPFYRSAVSSYLEETVYLSDFTPYINEM